MTSAPSTREMRMMKRLGIAAVAGLALAAPLAAQGDTARAVRPRSTYEDLQMFSQVLNQIRVNHPDSIDTHDLFMAAIQGMVHAADPHSFVIQAARLSPEKQRVFSEAFRVLRPAGRLAIADMVATAPLPDDIKADWAAYTGCMAGAWQITELERMLQASGFKDIKIAPKDSSRSFIREWLPGKRVEDYLVSATIEAIKPH